MKTLAREHETRGGLVYVADRAELSSNTLDQVVKGVLLPARRDGTRSPRTLGDQAARRIEQALGLGNGWFDADDGYDDFERKPSVEQALMVLGLEPATDFSPDLALLLKVAAKLSPLHQRRLNIAADLMRYAETKNQQVRTNLTFDELEDPHDLQPTEAQQPAQETQPATRRAAKLPRHEP